MEQSHERAAAREPDRGLPARVAAADDRDARRAAELRLGRAGRIEHAPALVVGELVEREPPVVGAGGEDDGACRDLVLVFQSHEMSAVAWLECGRAVRRRRPSAELAHLADGATR